MGIATHDAPGIIVGQRLDIEHRHKGTALITRLHRIEIYEQPFD